MFTKIGESKWMKIVLFITTFAFVGTALVALIVYKMSGKIAGAVEVNGREISMQRYMYEINLIQTNLERQGVDIAPLRKAIRQQALNNIINEELVYQEAEKEGLVATKEEVKEAILNIPAFQENGVFSKDKYLAVINSMGISPQFFEEILRKQLSQEHIFSLINGAAYITKEEIKPILQKELSLISGKALIIKPEVSVSEKELKEYYEKNKNLFAGEKGKKIVLYEINIEKLGKKKAAELAKKLFLSLKDNKPVEKTEGITKVFDDVLYKKEQLKNIPENVVKDLQTLSPDKKISFVKTDKAYYLAKFEKEVSKPMPFEKVKSQVEAYLKEEKEKKELENLYKKIKGDLKEATSLKDLQKKYKRKIKEIKNMSYRDILRDLSIPSAYVNSIFKTKKGVVKEPIRSIDSIVILEIDEITAKKEDGKDVENLIKNAFYREKVNDLINAYIIKLRQNADIKINPRLMQ